MEESMNCVSDITIRPVGCDAGNTSIKVVVDGEVYFVPTKIQKVYESRKILGREKGEPLDCIDVDFNMKGLGSIENLFVGNLSKNGSIESLGGHKSNNEALIKTMIISITAVLAKKYPEESSFTIRLGTGIPADEFLYRDANNKYSDEKIRLFSEKLEGSHRIKFNSSLYGKREIELNIPKEHIEVNCEGFTPLNYFLYDPVTGESKFPELTKKDKKILGIDIGGGSCDSSGICNDDFLEESIFGIDMGINTAQDKVCELIRAKANMYEFNRSDFNKLLYDAEYAGILETNRCNYNLHEEKEPFYREFSEQLIYEYRKRLNMNKLSTNLISALIIMGGAGEELSEHIKETFKDEIKNIIKVSEHMKEDPRALTALAYYSTVI